MTSSDDHTKAVLYGGPEDGATIHIDTTKDHIQIRGVTYRWDRTTNFLGHRRYRSIAKP